MSEHSRILSRARDIRLAVFDVDGVLTDGTLLYGPEGESEKRFHVHDGLGLKLLQEEGITVAILSSRRSAAVERRMMELGIARIIQGCGDKRTALTELCAELAIDPAHAAFTGDDLVDLGPMSQVGLAIAVANAHPAVLQAAHWTTRLAGGQGAVREVCDLLLDARGRLEAIIREQVEAGPA